MGQIVGVQVGQTIGSGVGHAAQVGHSYEGQGGDVGHSGQITCWVLKRFNRVWNKIYLYVSNNFSVSGC